MFKPIKHYSNLSEGIVNQILEAINKGKLKSGDKLPSEREMCIMFSVSRTVIRDALKTLAGLGVVTIRHGMGTFINEVNGEEEDVSRLASLLQISQGTIEELYQIREILESQAVFWCTQKATVKDLKELDDIISKAKKAIDTSKLPLLDAEFHLKIAEASGNRVLMRLMVNLLDLLGESRAKALLVPGRQKLSVLEHEAILEAIKKGNEMLLHLTNVFADIRNHTNISQN